MRGTSLQASTSYGPYGSIHQQTGTSQTSYGYTGEQFHAGTGLLYLRARYYSPSLHAFTARDPWEGEPLRPASLNGYSYAESNPIFYTDPTGREVRRPWTPEEEYNEVAKVLRYERIYGTRATIAMFDPTWGVDRFTLFNLKTSTSIGIVDIDWAFTLSHFSQMTGIGPFEAYHFGKIYWAIKDEDGALFNHHMTYYRNDGELRAIDMANDIVSGNKAIKDFFPHIDPDIWLGNSMCSVVVFDDDFVSVDDTGDKWWKWRFERRGGQNIKTGDGGWWINRVFR